MKILICSSCNYFVTKYLKYNVNSCIAFLFSYMLFLGVFFVVVFFFFFFFFFQNLYKCFLPSYLDKHFTQR